MGNGASQHGWESNYQELKNVHDEAFRAIEEAITLEEQERPNDAVEKYKQGILVIDKALDVVITCPENPDATWEQAVAMVQKMKKTRAEVLKRVTSITSSPDYIHHEPPPSYEDAMSSTSSEDGPRTYRELAYALDNLHIDTPQGVAEIVYSHDGVRLYFISPNGEVLSTSEPQTLNIAVIHDSNGSVSTAFLQVGSWTYPLVPGVSPCYRTDYGAFILPDIHSDDQGSSVGLILPEDADITVLELLENILHGVVTQEHKVIPRSAPAPRSILVGPPPIEEGFSGKISRGIVTGAYYISKGLIFGAQKAGDLLNYGTPKLISKLKPEPEPTNVSPNVAKGFKIAGNATSKAAEVTGFVAEKVGFATSKLGQFLAPHIQKQGTKLLTSGFKMSEEEASNKVNGVLTVAAGAVEGFATIYQGLETSASILGQNLKANSVKIVEHKYGPQAGAMTTEGMDTVGNIYNIRKNANIFTPKGIAKNAAKETGKAIIHDVRASTSGGGEKENFPVTNINQPGTSMQYSSSSRLYPSLNSEESFVLPDKSLEKKG